MHTLDDLLESPVTPYDDGAPPTAQQEAQALLAACELVALAPVAWLNQAADAFDSRLSGESDWHLALPADLAAHRAQIDAAPQVWQAALTKALHQQSLDYADLLALGSQPDGYPRKWLETQCVRHAERLLARFGTHAPAPSELAPYRALQQQRQDAWQAARTVLESPLEENVLATAAEPLRRAIIKALCAEIQLQAEEGQVPNTGLHQLVMDIEADVAHCLEVRWQGVCLQGVWVLADAHAWAGNLRPQPLLLWVQGEGGGLAYFEDIETLCAGLTFTLDAPVTCAMSDRLPYTSGDGTGVVLSSQSEGLKGAVDSLVKHWLQRLREATTHPSPDSELTASYALEQVIDEARVALAIPLDTTRHLALATAERQWQADAVVEHLPEWLLSRDAEHRQAFAEELQAYHEAAATLEYWLSERIPPFPAFAGQLLAKRIKQAFGIVIDPRQSVLERPVSVTYEWFGPGAVLEPSPEGTFPGGSMPHESAAGMRWVPSQAWETLTLEQLGAENLDTQAPAETERLRQAHWHVQGLTANDMLRLLPEVDALKQYKLHLQRTLDPALCEAPDLLRRPYELELRLQGLAAHWQQRLSAEGVALLRIAATEHDPAALAAQGLRVHWLVIHADEPLGLQVEGCCALVANESGHTLMFLPGAPQPYALLERDTLGEALDTLRDAIRTRDDMAAYMAGRLDGDAAKWLSWFRQAAQHRYDGYLRAPASLDQTLVAIQLHDRRAWLLTQARNEGRSQLDILRARNLAGHHRHLGYLRAALALVPGVGVLTGLESIYDGAQAAAAGWRQQDPEVFGLGLLGIAGGVVDVLFSALPVAGGLSGLRAAVRAHVTLRARLDAGRHALAGYQLPMKVRGATALKGRDQGTWRLNGQQYIWQDGRAYAVYRRSGEETLRLQGTATRLYQAPIRREGERWVIHADVGLRGGGGNLTETEQIFASWGSRSRHAPFSGAGRYRALREGRRLLAEYNFTSEARASEFAHAFLIDGTPPAWALEFRHGPGRAPVPVPPSDGWQQVRLNLTEHDHVIPGTRGGDVVIMPYRSTVGRQVIRWRGEYYPTVPGDVEGLERLIVPVGPLPRNLQELDELIRRGQGPVRVRLGETPVDAPVILGGYAQSFSERLAERFPGLAVESRQAMGQALYQGADVNTRGLTSVRLRALDRFLADPLAEPLRVLRSRRIESVEPNLIARDVMDHFDQLRVQLNVAEHTALRNALNTSESTALQAALEQIMTLRGYDVLFQHTVAGRYLCIFCREGHSQIHVLVQTGIIGRFSLRGNHEVTVLSDAWLDMIISRIPDMTLAARLRLARYHGHLDPMIGGVHAQGQTPAALIWERVVLGTGTAAQPVRVRNWRHSTRPIQAQDIETMPGSGLFRGPGLLAEGVRVDGRWLPIYPAHDDALLLLSRPADLPSPLTFEALEHCVRARFGEQPWLVAREGQTWTVRRHLFLAPLDRQVGRARPGVTPQSALNVARAAFLAAQGTDAARLLHLEYVFSSWVRDSRTLDGLADPMLLLAPQRLGAPTSVGHWQLTLPADAPSITPAVMYLRPVEQYTQGLVAAMSRQRMRHHAANAIDDMLTRYGLTLDHRAGNLAQYRQPSTNRLYLVAMHVSESQVTEVALDAGHPVLSNAWIVQWRQRISEPQRLALDHAMAEGRLVRLVATLRLDDGAMNGQVALQRLADF